jgi:hypothetical protein
MKAFKENPDDSWQTLELLPESRIAKGAKVLVDCWIPAVVGLVPSCDRLTLSEIRK